MQRKKPLNNKKPLRKLGKIGRYRLKRRAQWVKDHPPNHEGYYVCGICRKWVHYSEMELDHILPKSGTPRAIAELDSNLRPTHALCNQVKGSRRI